MARRSATNCCMCITENKLVCQKTCPVTSIGGKDSVKGNRQGSLSRSITRRSGQNRKIKYCFYFAILPQLVKKVRSDFFDKQKARRGSAGLCCGAGGRVQRSGSQLGEEGSFVAGCAAAGEGMRSDAVRYLFRGLYATAKTRRVIAMLGSMYARLYSRE